MVELWVRILTFNLLHPRFLKEMADNEGVNVEILQTEIEKSKEKLKNVEDNIRKLTGRDPNEFRFDYLIQE